MNKLFEQSKCDVAPDTIMRCNYCNHNLVFSNDKSTGDFYLFIGKVQNSLTNRLSTWERRCVIAICSKCLEGD